MAEECDASADCEHGIASRKRYNSWLIRNNIVFQTQMNKGTAVETQIKIIRFLLSHPCRIIKIFVTFHFPATFAVTAASFPR